MSSRLHGRHRHSRTAARRLRTIRTVHAALWIGPDGSLRREWHAPGEVDSWHVNGLYVRDGDLFATAFGDFRRHREWKEAGPTGFVFDARTGERVVEGLSAPHSPRFFDGAWVVCDSGSSALVAVDPATGERTRRASLRGWTRGLDYDEDAVYVGESPLRHARPGSPDRPSVAVLDRADWKLSDRFDLPDGEVIDVALVPRTLVDVVEARSSELAERVAAWETETGVRPLAKAKAADTGAPVEIRAIVPAELPVDATVHVRCTVANRSAWPIAASGSDAHVLGARWSSPVAATGVLDLSTRAALPDDVPPGCAVEVDLVLRTPPTTGRHVVSLALLQQHRQWLDDVDPRSGCRAEVVLYP